MLAIVAEERLVDENIVITDTSGQEVALIDTSTKMITAALIDVQELLAQDITLNGEIVKCCGLKFEPA